MSGRQCQTETRKPFPAKAFVAKPLVKPFSQNPASKRFSATGPFPAGENPLGISRLAFGQPKRI
jgi:hypothetical protein